MGGFSVWKKGCTWHFVSSAQLLYKYFINSKFSIPLRFSLDCSSQLQQQGNFKFFPRPEKQNAPARELFFPHVLIGSTPRYLELFPGGIGGFGVVKVPLCANRK